MNDREVEEALKGNKGECPYCPHQLGQHFESSGKCAVMKCRCPGLPNHGMIMSTEPINPEVTPPDTPPAPPPAPLVMCRVFVNRHGTDVQCLQPMNHEGQHTFPFDLIVKPEPKSVLQEADTIINGERQQDYGSPLVSFTTIASLWSVVLDIDVTADQVALCMIQLKVARAKNGGMQRDSLVDIAGYAGCIELMEKERNARGN